MVKVLALGEAWQRKNQSEVSPFAIGARVQRWRRRFKIFVCVSLTGLFVLSLLLAWTGGSGTLLGILKILIPVALLGITVGLYVSTYSHKCLVWDEFRQHHDALVKELDIQGASTASATITDGVNKRLQRQSGKIRKQLQAHASQSDVVTIGEVNALRAAIYDYWRFKYICKYLGLLDDEETVPASDELFSLSYLDGVSA